MEILYIDECSTNIWQKPSRIWIPQDKPFKIKIANTRREGATIIEAI